MNDPTVNLIVTCGLVTLALLALAGAVAFVKKWHERSQQVCDLSSADLLREFRQMQETGELSPDEFSKIKGVLTNRAERSAPTNVADTPSTPSNPA